jgi:hypothetical protein
MIKTKWGLGGEYGAGLAHRGEGVMRRPRIAIVCMLSAYLVVLGFFGGVVVSAMRFDGKRAASLSRLDDTTARVRAHLMRFEHDAARSTGMERARQ